MFVKVPYTKLVSGKKYKIIGHYEEYTGVYECFEQGKYFNLKFSNVKGTRPQGNVLFSTYKDFYEFVPHAQMKMERRAVNLILRHILGDDYFVW